MIVVRMLMLILIKQRPCQNAEFANFFFDARLSLGNFGTIFDGEAHLL